MKRVGQFEIYKDFAGRFRWRLWGRDGRLQADSSQGYDTAAAAREAAKQMRTEVVDAAVVAPDAAER